MHRLIHRSDSVFRQHDDARAAGLEMVDQVATDRINGAELRTNSWIVGTIFLERVVQVRQVDEIERWIVSVIHPAGGIGDPATGANRARGSPEFKQRECPKL